jgi:hypothetical protein
MGYLVLDGKLSASACGAVGVDSPLFSWSRLSRHSLWPDDEAQDLRSNDVLPGRTSTFGSWAASSFGSSNFWYHGNYSGPMGSIQKKVRGLPDMAPVI